MVLALALAGCAVDSAMRRADALDRVFEPERFAAPSAEAPVGGPPNAPIPVAAVSGFASLESDVAASPQPGVLPPGWYVPDPPAGPEEFATSPDPAPLSPAPPSPAQRTAGLLRQNPWVARFWSELTQAEQIRVTRALARRGAAATAPAAWDPMGLQDRVDLLFGAPRAAS
jgi:hypothetical protein